MGSRKRNEGPGTEVSAGQQRPITVPGGPPWGDAVDKDKVSAALRDLAAEHARTPRSQTARLREVLDDLEAALTAGEVAEGAAGAGLSPGRGKPLHKPNSVGLLFLVSRRHLLTVRAPVGQKLTSDNCHFRLAS